MGEVNGVKARQRAPKRITRSRLRNVAIAYVRRYGGSSARLRTVLQRRVDRSLRYYEESFRSQECGQWIDAVVSELMDAGVLDERRQARADALRHTLAGRPTRVIAQCLRLRGYASD